ncbi:hypothetical protein T05_1991 [Trichinella murrelli]|uniref:Uncharacterized protein n=1 Tax=Trichinella murrelli TaxID=144512 RepID=A0A0V0TMX5_9BILA|nr:hypothetical protein T05_1991 [Trichinella murrelli]
MQIKKRKTLIGLFFKFGEVCKNGWMDGWMIVFILDDFVVVIVLRSVMIRFTFNIFYLLFCTALAAFQAEKEERMQSKHKRKLATSIGMMYIAFGNHSFVHFTQHLSYFNKPNCIIEPITLDDNFIFHFMKIVKSKKTECFNSKRKSTLSIFGEILFMIINFFFHPLLHLTQRCYLCYYAGGGYFVI